MDEIGSYIIAIDELSNNYKILVDNIPKESELYRCHALLRNFLDNRKDYEPSFRKLIGKTVQEMPRPSVIEIGSIGAFLWGCYQNTHGDVKRGCSPLCLTSIGYHGENCLNYVFLYDGSLKLISPNAAILGSTALDLTHAQIYTTMKSINFNPIDIENLRRYNIITVEVFTTTGSQHQIILTNRKIDFLPIEVEEFDISEKDPEKTLEGESIATGVKPQVAIAAAATAAVILGLSGVAFLTNMARTRRLS